MNDIIAIGGSNIDYIARGENTLLKHDSNIGNLNISFGGVGRNIAENMTIQGLPVTFITTIGKDLLGKELVNDLVNKGANVIFEELNCNTSSYLAINDKNGDLFVAICDGKASEALDEKYLKKHEELIKSAKFVVMDCNNEAYLRYVASLGVKMIVDATSSAKVCRCKDIISKIYLLKLNEEEALTLSNGCSIDDAVDRLLAMGINQIIITAGSKNAIYASQTSKKGYKVKKVDSVVNTNGCGDAFVAGIVFGLYNNLSIDDTIECGMKMSRATLFENRAVIQNKIL